MLTELGKGYNNIFNPNGPVRIPVGHPPIEDIRSEPIRAKRPLESESRVQFLSLDRLPPPQDAEQELQGAHSVHSSEDDNRTKSRLSRLVIEQNQDFLFPPGQCRSHSSVSRLSPVQGRPLKAGAVHARPRLLDAESQDPKHVLHEPHSSH